MKLNMTESSMPEEFLHEVMLSSGVLEPVVAYALHGPKYDPQSNIGKISQ